MLFYPYVSIWFRARWLKPEAEDKLSSLQTSRHWNRSSSLPQDSSLASAAATGHKGPSSAVDGILQFMGFGLFILNSPTKATVDSCDQCPLQNVNVKSTCSLFLKYVIHLACTDFCFILEVSLDTLLFVNSVWWRLETTDIISLYVDIAILPIGGGSTSQ